MVVKRKAMRDEKLISKQRTQDSHNVEKKTFHRMISDPVCVRQSVFFHSHAPPRSNAAAVD